MRKQFLKCATAFLLTVSLLLSMLPLLVGAEEKDTSQPIEGSASAIENVEITPTPADLSLNVTSGARSVYGDQTANRDPSSPGYIYEVVLNGTDDPNVENHEYLSSTTTTIPDGVYSIESLAYEMLGMFNLYSLYEPYSDDFVLQLWDYQGLLPTEYQDQFGTFKITKKPNTNCYVIRWMSNSCYGFTGAGGSLALKALPYNDADVALADTFTITYDGGGFVIKPYGSSTAISIPASADPYDGPELILQNPSSAGALARWKLIRYTGPSFVGIYIEGDTQELRNGLDLGETVNLKFYAFTSFTSYNAPFLTRHPDNINITDRTTILWDEGTQDLTITAHRGTIETLYLGVGGHSAGYNLPVFVRDIYIEPQPIEDGVYYIQNRQTETFLQINDAAIDENYFQQIGAHLELWEPNYGNQMRWIVTHEGDGYYKIKSYVSGQVLSVPQDNVDGIALTQNVDSGLGHQRFKIMVGSGYSYVIRQKSGEDDPGDWCIGSGNYAWVINGLNAEPRIYTNDSNYKDEWVFYPCNKYSYTSIIDERDSVDEPADIEEVEEFFWDQMEFGYGNHYFNTEEDFLNQLFSVELATVITHGSRNSFTLNMYDSAGCPITSGFGDLTITLSEIRDFNPASDALPKVVAFGSCYAGANGTGSGINNVVDAVYMRGADFVLGFTDAVNAAEISYWMPEFVKNLKNGATVTAARGAATSALQNKWIKKYRKTPDLTTTEIYIRGEENTVPFPR